MRKNAHVLLGTCSCFFMFTMDMVICMFYPRHMQLNPSSKSKFAQVEFFDLLLSRSLAPMSWSQILCFFFCTLHFLVSVFHWDWEIEPSECTIYIYTNIHIHNYHLSLSGEGLSNMSRVILPESLEDYMISYWGALQLPIAKDACYFLTNLYLCCLHQPVWISYVYISYVYTWSYMQNQVSLRMKPSPFRVILGYTGIPLVYDDINRAPPHFMIGYWDSLWHWVHSILYYIFEVTNQQLAIIVTLIWITCIYIYNYIYMIYAHIHIWQALHIMYVCIYIYTCIIDTYDT